MTTKQQCAGVVTREKAHNKGEPCRRWAVHGSDYCAVHGGNKEKFVPQPEDLQNRCTAKSTRSGEQCKKSAIKGGTVCKTHGGSAAHVANKARERLNELVEPALVQLNRILSAQGTSDSDRLRSIQMVLDRTGFGPGSTIEHEVKPWEITIQSIFKQSAELTINREVPEAMRAELEAERERQSSYATGVPEDIEDAEIVDDDVDHVPAVVTPIRPRGSAEPPRRNR